MSHSPVVGVSVLHACLFFGFQFSQRGLQPGDQIETGTLAALALREFAKPRVAKATAFAQLEITPTKSRQTGAYSINFGNAHELIPAQLC